MPSSFGKSDTLVTPKGSSFNSNDTLIGESASPTGLYENMTHDQDVADVAGEVYGLSQELDMPVWAVEDNYLDIKGIVDPSDLEPFLPPEDVFEPEQPPQIGAQDKEKAQKAQEKFELERYSFGQKARLTLTAASKMPLRTFIKFGKGMLLGTPDIAWAGIKRVLPKEMYDIVKNQTLDQAMDAAMNYNPSGFSKFVGEVAEFSGGIKTVAGKLGKIPKSATVLDKAVRSGGEFALAKAAREGSKLAAEVIDPKVDYGYEGAIGIITDLGLGFGFSLIGSASKPIIEAALKTKTGKIIMDGFNRAVVKASIKFPQLADAIRRNPSEYFRKEALKYAKSKGKDITNLTPKEESLINHTAREAQRIFSEAYKNYTAPDIVKRRARLLEAGKVAEKEAAKAAQAAKPKVPAKAPVKVKPLEAKQGVKIREEISRLENEIEQRKSISSKDLSKLSLEPMEKIQSRIKDLKTQLEAKQEAVGKVTAPKAKPVISNPDVAKLIDDAKPDILSGVKTGKPASVEVVRGFGRATKEEVFTSGEGESAFGEARYSAIDETFAKHFGPKIEKLTIQLDNPFVLTNDQQLAELVGRSIPRDGKPRQEFLREARTAIEELGHDGIIINIPNFGDVDTAGKSAKRLIEISGATQTVEFQPTPTEPLEPVPPQLQRLDGGKQAGGTTIIPDIVTETTEVSKRLGSNLSGVAKGTKEIFSRNVKRYTGHLKSLGVRGGAVAKDFEEITQRTQKRVNNSVLDSKEILKGVSKENREKITKTMNKRLKNPPKWIQKRADKLTAVLDEVMNEARDIGIQRRVKGEKVEIRGSGKAFPQVPNTEGDKLLKEAGKFGSNSPFVLSVAQEAMDTGLASSTADYIAQLQWFREQQLRGVSSYLERARVELPERFIEWDPDRVLDNLLQKTWLTVEGTRQWGTDTGGLSFPKLALQIEAIRTNHGPDEAKLLEQFVKAAFGQELLSTEASRKISGVVRGYQFLTKIAFSQLSILRNVLDRFPKATSLGPTSVLLRTIGQYPPIINAFISHSRKLEEKTIRQGAVFSNTAIAEGYQPGHLFTKLAGKEFSSSERGNQVFIALAKKNAIDFNLKLLKTNPKIAAIFDKRIGGLLSPLEAIGRSPRQAIKRLTDLGSDELIAKLESVDDIPPDLLEAILHKTVKDLAFPVDLSTKRSWWDNKPFMRMVAQFKIWGTDQVGHVWNDVIRQSVKNRDPSLMVRWLTTMAVMGEIYNIIRDFVLGKDESLLSTLSNKEKRNLKDISITVLKDMLDGGAVGILFDVMYGLPNLIGGPSLQTVKSLGEATVKSVWNPSQAKDAIKQIATKETPALRQAQGILDKIDAQFQKKNITQDYYEVRNRGYEWSFKKKFPKNADKAKKMAVQAILGWVKNVPQERTLSYEMAIRQIIVGDIEDASEHLFFLLKTADGDDELLSLEQGIVSALNNASPLGSVAEKDNEEFFRGMSSEQRRTATSTQLRYDRNSSEAYGLAVRKFEKWQRENR